MKKRIKKLHHSNKGFSLMELIVTMLISSIVTAAVAGFLSMGLNYYRRTNAETALQTESQVTELFLTELLQESQAYEVLEAAACPAGVSFAVEVTRDDLLYIVAQKGNVLVYGKVVDQTEPSVTARIQSITDQGMDKVFLAQYVENLTIDPTIRTTAVSSQNGLVKLNVKYNVDGKTYFGKSTVSLRNTVKN